VIAASAGNGEVDAASGDSHGDGDAPNHARNESNVDASTYRAMARPPNVRAVGVDLGSKRIGIALSDLSGTIATPFDVLARTGSRRRDHDAIARLCREEEADIVVVGLPLNMDGSLGAAAQGAIAEAEALASVVGVPVVTFDERRSTVTADQALMEQRMNAQARRRVIDKVAAAVMLQHWLDAGRPGG
jgi:putative holliday junction resolvase